MPGLVKLPVRPGYAWSGQLRPGYIRLIQVILVKIC
jgi:hypothetical protein